MCGGKNKKYRRIGNKCRLILCPFNISFLFCLFTIVYFSIYVCRFCLLHLAVTVETRPQAVTLFALACQTAKKFQIAHICHIITTAYLDLRWLWAVYLFNHFQLILVTLLIQVNQFMLNSNNIFICKFNHFH